MRFHWSGLSLALLFAFSASAASQEAQETEVVFPQQMNANDLLTLCASSSLTTKGRSRRKYCDGFVSGIEEGMRLYRLRYRIESAAAICVPEGTTARVMTQTFLRHASSKGVDLSQPAAAVVLTALHDGFPC